MSATAATDRPVTRDDLEAKLRELKGDVSETAESAKSTLIMVGAAVAVVVVAAAFFMGKRRGKHKRTVLEIRRL